MHILAVEALLVLQGLSMDGKENYTPDTRPALQATPRRLTGDALPRPTGDALSLH